ncbi:hypothetical protein HanPSC8_Chr04g0173171 [Helianthus annuus]|nr:hypothetical protein HanPSC8_Chr04g0173171 [Helianthus annuus]
MTSFRTFLITAITYHMTCNKQSLIIPKLKKNNTYMCVHTDFYSKTSTNRRNYIIAIHT